MNRALATSIAAFPFVLAFGLYATGTLERIDAALDLATARYRWNVSKPPPGPTRALEEYAGWWQRDGVPNYGADWVERVIVRTEGKKAWLRMWHRCPPIYCEQGEFEAIVHGNPPGNVYPIEVVRKRGKEVLWIVTLRPNGDNPKSLLILDDRRARNPSQSPMDNHSSLTSLQRVK